MSSKESLWYVSALPWLLRQIRQFSFLWLRSQRLQFGCARFLYVRIYHLIADTGVYTSKKQGLHITCTLVGPLHSRHEEPRMLMQKTRKKELGGKRTGENFLCYSLTLKTNVFPLSIRLLTPTRSRLWHNCLRMLRGRMVKLSASMDCSSEEAFHGYAKEWLHCRIQVLIRTHSFSSSPPAFALR